MFDLDAIKEKADLAAIITADLGEGKRQGKWLMWKCPFHADATPSFAVGPDNKVYKCFGCGETGDVFSWGTSYRGLDFKEWGQQLGGENLPEAAPRKPEQSPRFVVSEEEWPEPEWETRLIKVMLDCHKLLFEPIGSPAKLWLNGPERHLADETLLRYWIGFNPTSRLIHGHWLYAGIVIPHLSKRLNTIFGLKIRLNAQGRKDWLAIQMKRHPGRAASEFKVPKYISVSGQEQNIFNVDSLEYGEDDGFFYTGTGEYKPNLFICEGEFDCLLLEQFAGDLVASITLGSASNRLPARWLPALGKAKRFYLCLDTDKAGQNGLAYWQDLTGQRGRRAVLPREGKDITDLVRAGHDLRQWVLNELKY